MKAPAVSLLLVLLVACDAPQATGASNSATLRATATPTPAATPVSFRKELREGNHRFMLQTTGRDPRRQMELRVEKNGQELIANTQAVEGTVEDALVTNLDNDPFPEPLVFITDAGSGSYGQLVGNENRRTHLLPDLSGAAAQGYQGYDTFRVESQQVVRAFPIFLDADPSCCPSGGQRLVRYQLPVGSVVFQQVDYRNQTR